MEFSHLMGLASGHVDARIVQTALRLGVFDVIDNFPETAESVAAKLQLEGRATELLLNALAALELLRKQAQSFSLAPVSQKYLVRSSPWFVGGMILFEDSLWQCWEKLPDAIRSGTPARPANMFQDDPKETEVFINAMDSLVKARGDAEALIPVLNWQEVEDLLDVGSGPATYPIELCKQFPNIRAAVFDLPGTLKITERCVRDAGMAERVRLIPGDYRKDAIPGHYDVVFLSNIIHGEDEQNNQMLIDKLSRNLKPSGQIVIKDHILDDSGASPRVGALFSLLMLLTTAGGRCYSFTEIKGWMERAGLPRIRQIDLPPPLTSSLVVAGH
jgi:SAM-dependent methyltransferase